MDAWIDCLISVDDPDGGMVERVETTPARVFRSAPWSGVGDHGWLFSRRRSSSVREVRGSLRIRPRSAAPEVRQRCTDRY